MTFGRERTPRGKALLSLTLTFASRAPAIIGLLIFIPLVHERLGDNVYGAMMAAISLGGLASFLFIGGNTLGRRRIGEAMAEGRREDEAHAFLTMVRASLMAGLIGFLVALALTWGQTRGPIYLGIALLPLINSLTGVVDEARAAYNEHYVTAATQFVLQVIAYALALSVAWIPTSAIASAAVMVAPGIVASLIAGALLLRQRPYLLRGHGGAAWRALLEGLPIGMIDGLVMAALALSVVLAQEHMTAAGGAWYATLVRIFMVALAPVLMTLVPLTSYLRGVWDSHHHTSQRRILDRWIGLSLAYGAVTLAFLWIANAVYLRGVMGLRPPIADWSALPIYAGLAAVLIFKSFTGFGYMMLGTRPINRALAVTLAITMVAAAVTAASGRAVLVIQVASVIFAVGVLATMAIVRRDARGGRPGS